MISRSTAYKLVLNNHVIAEGSKANVRKLQKKTPGSIIGLSPSHRIGDIWAVMNFEDARQHVMDRMRNE